MWTSVILFGCMFKKKKQNLSHTSIPGIGTVLLSLPSE